MDIDNFSAGDAPVRSRQLLSRVTRQCCDVPDLVRTASWQMPAGSGSTRHAVMARCREVLTRLGYDTVTVVEGRRARSAVSGTTALRRLVDDEARAEREDYWWSGDICWSNPGTGSHLVVPESGRARSLHFVAWGPEAETTLAALRDALG